MAAIKEIIVPEGYINLAQINSSVYFPELLLIKCRGGP